jgi:predicted transcriptional regulator
MELTIKEKVLKLLSNYPEGILQSSIYRALKVSKSRVSEVLKDLEALGLIVRVRVGNQYVVKSRVQVGDVLKGRVIRLGIVWSSEYPFIAPFIKLLKDRLGFEVRVTVYTNAITATSALVRNEVDLALTPLITQLYAYSLTKSLRILGGGVYGGSAVMVDKSSGTDEVLCSEFSTMDLCRLLAVNDGFIDSSTTKYFSNPLTDLLPNIRYRRFKYVVVWHPLTEYLRMHNYEYVVSCSDLGIRYCCTLASTTAIDTDLRSKISEVYQVALEEYSRDPSKWVEWYSVLVGISPDLIVKSISEYKLQPYIDLGLIRETFSKARLGIPDISSLLGAFEFR